MRRHLLTAIVAVAVVAAVASAVLLSNVVVFEGPLAGGVINLSEIGSGGLPGVLSMTNDTAKVFEWNATNTANRTVTFDLRLNYLINGLVHGGFTVFSFNWSLDGQFLNDTPDGYSFLYPGNPPISWWENVSQTFAPFESRSYALTVRLAFTGAGTYKLTAMAADT